MQIMCLRLPCGRSRGLCKCLWPGQNHRSSPLCFQTATRSSLPDLCECTDDGTQKAQIMKLMGTCVCWSSARRQTLREARNSIPRATWKLKEMRSSRRRGEADFGSGRGTNVMVESSCKQFGKTSVLPQLLSFESDSDNALVDTLSPHPDSSSALPWS